jgi:hypothetical protein
MPEEEKRDRESPPGEFVSEDLRSQTARFLEELKRRLSGEAAEDPSKPGPPKGQSPRPRD